jgi:uncharacterized alpha-E superfamily protein
MKENHMLAAISITKAENLFWLGRYTQRVYTILHFFRKHRDMIIDVDTNSYQTLCYKLGVENKYTSSEDFLYRYLFDRIDGNSLISALIYAYDNVIVRREDIKSETLAYVEMCVREMERCTAKNDDVYELRSVTDSLMAFWGSVDERIFRRDIRNMIKAGWYLETVDLHIRFDYSYDRLLQLLERLARHLKKEEKAFDQTLFLELRQEMENPAFDKLRVLGMLERLFVL